MSQLTNQQKESIIAKALETDAGRQSLAQAMVAPIRRAMNYAAIGRKMLMVDELPNLIPADWEETKDYYERDIRRVG